MLSYYISITYKCPTKKRLHTDVDLFRIHLYAVSIVICAVKYLLYAQ
ncbi:hypothetical protein BACPEC_00700 [[Bacteroides] pectinophilus ATCC 43243]|uniref:Uncharacterized protein n=1 Tax=[Bacteroides] pectinophilus ATCC 43243 TaxID=483218 RepID=B7APU4_9FIRM|nr:hypothetical protein BACPEC_00700 [[Bacteroides] pectinophilus ATCC 43243]